MQPVRLAHTVQGQRNCSGILLAADDEKVEVGVSEEVRLMVPYAAIRKAHLVVDDE